MMSKSATRERLAPSYPGPHTIDPCCIIVATYPRWSCLCCRSRPPHCLSLNGWSSRSISIWLISWSHIGILGTCCRHIISICLMVYLSSWSYIGISNLGGWWSHRSLQLGAKHIWRSIPHWWRNCVNYLPACGDRATLDSISAGLHIIITN